MGIQVVRGRAFGEQDRQDSLPVVIVNQKLAERAWPGGDPLGRRLRTGKNWLTVVGVEGDVRQWDLTQEVRPEIYFPYAQNPAAWWLQTSLVVHTGVPPESLVRAVQAKVWAIDPLMPVTNIRPMEQILAHDSGSQRFNAILLALFSLLAVVLAAVGIYGVISYSVSQRTHEIGIRMALGAQPRDIFRLVVGQGMVLTLIGVAVGLVGAFALTRFLSSLLFGVSTTDPATFAGVALLLAAVALLACYFPARRATRVDPLVALRYE
ncbi:MAG: FtsX-like permease family protein [Acidobacteria bacterium]|nr:FtsX-like permease family protein [Acidobacteriota bacterium]